MLDTLIARIRGRINDNREHGASAVEYALLVAAIAALVVVAVFTLGNWTDDAFDQTCSQVGAQSDSPDCTPVP